MLLLRVQEEYRRVQKKRRRRRSVWVRPWIERRVQLGQYTRLMEELRLEDVKAFKNFLRVEPELYELVERVSHRIWKQDTAYSLQAVSTSWVEGCHNDEVSSFWWQLPLTHVRLQGSSQHYLQVHPWSVWSDHPRIFLRSHRLSN